VKRDGVEAVPHNIGESDGVMGSTRESDVGTEWDGVAQVMMYKRTRQAQSRFFTHRCRCGERGEGGLDLVWTQIHTTAHSFDLPFREKVIAWAIQLL